MPVLTAGELSRTGCGILASAGVPAAAARTVVAQLVAANLAGHDSHGVIRIPQYLAALERGQIDPHASILVREAAPAALLVDGGWGFGQVVMARAVAAGVDRARRLGVAAVTVRRAGHMGRLGSYVEGIAGQGMIGVLFANLHGGGRIVVPWGGRQSRLATNPVAIGVPRRGAGPLVLDMATSVVAEGKVRVQRNRGMPLPLGWVVDAEGEPTTDPWTLYRAPVGGLLPFGGPEGHKGFGLGLAVDLLGGALSGAGCAGGTPHHGNGALLLVVDVAHFTPLEEFHAQVDELAGWLLSATPMPGCGPVKLPGDPEARTRQRRQQEGIPVEQATWEELLAWGRKVGWPGDGSA
ncbi:MAG: Ldh family oxidoreductase [Candidatus Latescibacterota bacterium]